MNIRDRIRASREAAGLSKSELARRIGVKPSASIQWEAENGTTPSVENLAKVAVECDVSFEWLATGRGSSFLSEPPPPAYMKSEESELLELFRRLSAEQQKALLILLRT